MQKFKETLIKEIEFDAIDCEFPFFTGEEPNEVEMIDNVWSMIESIDIDKIVNALNDLKFNGADRVYLYAHADHRSYILTGVKLDEVT